MIEEKIITDNLINVNFFPPAHETHELDSDQSSLAGSFLRVTSLRIFDVRCGRAF